MDLSAYRDNLELSMNSSVNRDKIQIGFLEFDSREHYDYSLRSQIHTLSGAHVAPAICYGVFYLGDRNRNVQVTTQFHQQPVIRICDSLPLLLS